MHRRERRKAAGLAVLALLAGLVGPLPGAATEAMRLGTTPWPPYVGPELPDYGATGAVVEAALKTAGLDLAPVFQEAVNLEAGFGDLDLDGIFPVYATPARRPTCLMSHQIGSSPLGFAERRSTPVTWEALEDLAPHTVGIVRNYANTDAFDGLVARGVVSVVRAEDDTANLQNLLDGTVDLAVIDRNVMEWLLRNNPSLAGRLNAVRFNARPLAERSLHVCFRPDDRGRAAQQTLNEALARIDGPRLTAEWFRRVTGTR